MAGFVYVMSNPAMPGLVKIGRTDRLPSDRAKDLFTTGVPMEFDIEFAAWTRQPAEIEAEVHAWLSRHRHQPNREFFKIDVALAIRSVCQCVLDSSRAEDLAVIDADHAIHEIDLCLYAQKCGLETQSIPRIVSLISDAAWDFASARYSELLKKRAVAQKCGEDLHPFVITRNPEGEQ